MHSERRHGRQQSRVLYWFRTPPGVKVGRPAFDAEIQRRIERAHPDIHFDWARILKNQPEPGSGEGERPERFDRDSERQARRPGLGATAASARDERGRDTQRPPRRESPRAARPSAPQPGPAASEARQPTAAEVERQAEAPQPAQPPILEGPAFDRLGADGVSRLRGRYLDIVARLTDRPTEDAAVESLRQEAERLNPDGWASDAEVTRGLEEYESVLEALRPVVGLRRRRRRHGGRGVIDEPPAAEAGQTSNAGGPAAARGADVAAPEGDRDE